MAQPTYPHDIVKDYVWWIDRGKIAIAYAKDTPSGDRLLSDGSYNSSNGVRQREYTGEWLSPHIVATVRVFCIKKAEVFTIEEEVLGTAPSGKFHDGEMNDQPEFPKQFHRALVYYVIAKGYEANPQLMKLSEVFETKYREYKDKACKFVNNKRFYGPKQLKSNRVWGVM